jgi:hypothetical protein
VVARRDQQGAVVVSDTSKGAASSERLDAATAAIDALRAKDFPLTRRVDLFTEILHNALFDIAEQDHITVDGREYVALDSLNLPTPTMEGR